MKNLCWATVLLTVFLSNCVCASDLSTPSFCPSSLLSGYRKSKALLTHLGAGPRAIPAVGSENLPIDGTHVLAYHSYNTTFARALGERSIERFAVRRRRAGLPTNLLDLFGSGIFSPMPRAFDSVTGVRLRPIVEREIGIEYSDVDWEEIVGNIFERATWQKLDRSSDSRGIVAFDIITMRPVGPLDGAARDYLNTPFESNFLGFSHALLDRAWRRLSFNDGILLLQTKEEFVRLPSYQDWLRLLDANGIEYSQPDSHAIKIVKRQNSPAQFPLEHAK